MFRLMVFILLTLPLTGFAQTVQWDVSLWGKRRAFTEHIEKLSELVAQRTNGEFVLNLVYGGKLADPRDNLEWISKGRFEMAQFCAGYHREKNPAITVLELPFLGVKTLQQERVVSQYLYRHPAILADFERWGAVALMPSPLPNYNLIGTGDVPTALSDLAGLRVRATGGVAAAVRELGSNAYTLTAPETKPALDAGTINAVAFAPHAHLAFQTVGVATWWTENLNPGTVNCPVVANSDAISKLPRQYRDALYGSINEALDYHVENYEYNLRNSWGAVLEELDVEVVRFSESELESLRAEVAARSAAEWIDENDARGLPADQLYRYVQSAIKGENPEVVFEQEFAQEAIAKAEAIARAEELKALEAQRLAEIEAAKVAEAAEEERRKEVLESYTFDQKPPALNDSEFASFPRVPERPPFLPTDPNVEPVGVVVDEYFGKPRSSTNQEVSADPLEWMVEWELGAGATVGNTVAQLSEYIGYELLGADEIANKAYGRALPATYRRLQTTTVAQAFEILSGKGLMTVVNHADRTIKQLGSQTEAANDSLPLCPEEITLATISRVAASGDMVLMLPTGAECLFEQ